MINRLLTHLEVAGFLSLDKEKVEDPLISSHGQEDRVGETQSLQAGDPAFAPRFEDVFGVTHFLKILHLTS